MIREGRRRMPPSDFFKKRGICSDQERGRDKKEVEGLHPLPSMENEPIPGVLSRLLCYFALIGGYHPVSPCLFNLSMGFQIYATLSLKAPGRLVVSPAGASCARYGAGSCVSKVTQRWRNSAAEDYPKSDVRSRRTTSLPVRPP